jgi:predicted dehydrogenase
MRIGILGAAGIAGTALVEPARQVDEVEVAAVAARDPGRAEAYARDHGIAVAHRSYQELLDDTSLDAIYVPLANSLHAQWSMAALDAGRHVLCEKPLASNAEQAAAMVATADRCQRVLMEAFHWRYHPVANRMIELGRAIGPLERVEVRFHVAIAKPNGRWERDLAGGSFMDLGCYCMHMARTVVGREPTVTAAVAEEGPEGVDASMEAELRFGDGCVAVVSSSMTKETPWPEAMSFRAWGPGGRMEVLNPMAPQMGHHVGAELADGTVIDEVLSSESSYVHQLRAFCAVVDGTQPLITGGADAVANMRAMDAVYVASGLGPRT